MVNENTPWSSANQAFWELAGTANKAMEEALKILMFTDSPDGTSKLNGLKLVVLKSTNGLTKLSVMREGPDGDQWLLIGGTIRLGS